MKRFGLVVALLVSLTFAHTGYAASGGVSGLYEYDGEKIDGVVVELYKIADYTEGGFVFHEGYTEATIGAMTNSELGEYGQVLAEEADVPDAVTQTTNGEYAFSAMDEGIYLVTFKDITIGDYSYSALPIVLTMPDANLNYQIALTTKLEKSCPDCVEPEPEPTPPDKEDNSDTRDRINLYIRIFVVLILLETLTLLVIIKERKREDSDEEK